MNSNTGEIMSILAMAKLAEELKQEHVKLNQAEADELIPMHLEDRLRHHERRAQKQQHRELARSALKNSR